MAERFCQANAFTVEYTVSLLVSKERAMSTALQSSVQAVAPPSQLRQKLLRAKQELCATVLGYEDEIEMMLLCLVADGNVSALGDPGTGKTLSMKALARVLGGSHYRRVQMVPDLMPADILGTEVWNKETGEFTYMHGPLNPLVNLIHADEINRTPPRTQAALLEAMEEKQFSVPGCTSQTKNTYPLHEVCLVLATRNAIDSVEGTYPLPSAELDRFAVELYFRRLSREKELEVVRKTSFARHSLAATQEGVLNIADIPSIRNEVESTVVCKERAFQYAENIIFATRPEG